jgi:hypothetical protein
MVKISNVLQRTTAEGKTFIVLELEGGLQVQKSQTAGNLYVCIPKCTIPCTFDEETARGLIGSTLPGEIIRIPCESYTFINPQTKEPLTLHYRYSYEAPGSASNETRTTSKRSVELDVL